MCACINYEQVRMDYVLLIPPPPFFKETRAKFDTTLENCWYGRVILLFRVQVKLDKKDCDGMWVRMDCDCAMIECLYDFARGRCTCARFAVGLQNVCIGFALRVH
jgi:hypothetical protein